MARYTTELSTIVMDYSSSNKSLNERIEEARQYLFDFQYPFFDEAERKGFETRFIRHFFKREIGFETEELFKFSLETWLLINMPYFNQLLASERLKIEPFISYDLTTESTRRNDKKETIDSEKNMTDSELTSTERGETQNISSEAETSNNVESSGNAESSQSDAGNSFNRQLKSTTPDSRLQITTNDDGTGVIEYASEIDENKLITSNSSDIESTDSRTETTLNNQTASTETSLTGNESASKSTTAKVNDDIKRNEEDTEQYSERRFGTIGVKTMAEMLNEYRATFLRVERDIFKEMNSLFMGIY